MRIFNCLSYRLSAHLVTIMLVLVSGLVAIPSTTNADSAVGSGLEFAGSGAYINYTDFVKIGDYCYLSSWHGLTIVDAHNPSVLTQKNSIEWPPRASGLQEKWLATDGTYLFALKDSGGVTIFDLSNPLKPDSIAGIDLPSRSDKIEYYAPLQFLYVNNVNLGLGVIDLADVAHPVLRSFYRGYGSYYFDPVNICPNDLDIFVSHQYLYLNPLEVVGVSDPDHPNQAAYFSPDDGKPRFAGWMISNPPYVYALDNSYEYGNKLRVMDYQNGMQMVDSVTVGKDVSHAVRNGSRLYAGGGGLIEGYDLADPAHPVRFFQMNVDNSKLLVDNGVLYVLSLNGLKAMPLGVEGYPVESASLNFGAGRGFIVGWDHYLATSTQWYGTDLFDVSNPSNLKLLSHLGYSTNGYNAVFNSWLFLQGEVRTLMVNIADPSHPILAAECPTRNYSGDPGYIAVDNSCVYVASYRALSIYAYTTSPPVIELRTYFPQSEGLTGLVVKGIYAYVLRSNGPQAEIEVIDVSNSRAPVVVTSVAIPDAVEAIDLVETANLLYCSASSDYSKFWLQAIDISDPRQPVIRGSYDKEFPNRSFRVGGVAGRSVVGWESSSIPKSLKLMTFRPSDPDVLFPYAWIELTPWYSTGSFGGIRFDGKLLYSAEGNAISMFSGLPCCMGNRGDVDLSGTIDLRDLSTMISFLTGDALTPFACAESADLDVSGVVNLVDLSRLVQYLTGGGGGITYCP